MFNQEQQNFLKAFEDLIGNEGGYVNHPNDPGGETKFGITKRTYPHLSIKELTVEKARDIYYQDFWLRCCCDKMPYALAFEVLDASVHHGQVKAIMLLQKALGVADDGKIGPITEKAIASLDPKDIYLRFNAYRLRFLAKLSTWDTFGRGWANRIANNLLKDAENN